MPSTTKGVNFDTRAFLANFRTFCAGAILIGAIVSVLAEFTTVFSNQVLAFAATLVGGSLALALKQLIVRSD